MVISTFLSAPIMYVSAWLLTIPLMDPTPLVTELENVSFNISIVSLVALVSMLVSHGSIKGKSGSTAHLLIPVKATQWHMKPKPIESSVQNYLDLGAIEHVLY